MADNGDVMPAAAGQPEGNAEEVAAEQASSGPPSRAARYPCIRCKKNVASSGVRCKTCQLWVHVACANISKELFSILANPGKYGANVSWNCDSCVASAARLDERMNLLEGRFQEVESRVVRAESTCQETIKRVDNVEGRQEKLEQAMEQERERMRKERMEEMRERDIRKKNVVMHRVGEAGEEVKSLAERRNWDMKSCDNIFRALKLEMQSENVIKFCRRVGEKGAGPRPLIVGFRREAQKEDLLDRARDLRDTDFADVVIIPDLTHEQRKEEAELVKEAERRNSCLTQEEVTKNLEWSVVGARGERRLVRGVARGAARGRPIEGGTRGRGGHLLLPSVPRPDSWLPSAVRGGAGTRGRAAGTRGRTTKRRRGYQENEDENVEEEEEMDEEGPAPPPQPGRA
jgi:hypothetical protein